MDLLRRCILPKMDVKTKELGPIGGCALDRTPRCANVLSPKKNACVRRQHPPPPQRGWCYPLTGNPKPAFIKGHKCLQALREVLHYLRVDRKGKCSQHRACLLLLYLNLHRYTYVHGYGNTYPPQIHLHAQEPTTIWHTHTKVRHLYRNMLHT